MSDDPRLDNDLADAVQSIRIGELRNAIATISRAVSARVASAMPVYSEVIEQIDGLAAC